MAEREDTSTARRDPSVNDRGDANIGRAPSNSAGTPDQGDDAVNMMTFGKLMSGTSAGAIADIHSAPAGARGSETAMSTAELSLLDTVADNLPDDYGAHWVAAAQRLGLTVFAGIDPDGTDYISIGARCDGTERETSAWIKSLSDHKDGVEGGRGQIIEYIRQSDTIPFIDERTSAPRATTMAVRGFLAAGFRLFLDTRGRVQTGGAMPDAWWHGTPQQQQEIGAYARAFDDLRRRHNIERQLRRLIRLVGVLHEGSGCIVLEKKGN